jgi:hypothetical protein
MSATSDQVRRELAEALRLSLVGPDNAHAFAREVLPEPPFRWYLTGFLTPRALPVEDRSDPEASEEIDSPADAGALDDASPPEKAAARRSPLPSSLGLSVLVQPTETALTARVAWGDYERYPKPEETAPPVPEDPAEQKHRAVDDESGGYLRIPQERVEEITLPSSGKSERILVRESGGLLLFVTVRPVSTVNLTAEELPSGTRSVAVFLVNERTQADPKAMSETTIFQATLRLESKVGLVARPDLRGRSRSGVNDEWDERIADLHYRDVAEYAVGHGVSARAFSEGGVARAVESVWIPQAEVERVAPTRLTGVELEMEKLAALSSGDEAAHILAPLVGQYREWIAAQRRKFPALSKRRKETAELLLHEAGAVADRIESGIAELRDPLVLESFQIANRTMAVAARRREALKKDVRPEAVPAPRWFPFQLGFLLMTIRGVAHPEHADRESVDLLFFPTGGGKTEAYLGLAAFTMVLRRLRHPGIASAGVSVLMRYTLRLLTLDQLGRAATLICALELERQRDPRLGIWPFEIGLWVGSAATPNRMGSRGYKGPSPDTTAYTVTQRYKRASKNSRAPIPLENCPWCAEKFGPDSFRLVPSEIAPLNLEVRCTNHRCEFSRDRALPILGVDEPIYRRLPAFLIATVDKFASLPWTGETGALFGRVSLHDKDGFYGPCQTKPAMPLPGGMLLPPDLIIQDELHLISGPLGTIAGVYETAIDELASREVDGRRIRPKIIASTATVRRAERQIRALFGREQVVIFPAPGPDRRDSFFARTEAASADSPPRLYVGVAAQGRSLKVVFLRAALALLSAAKTAYEREGGLTADNPADPYMTLLGYFNSLRELGGSRRIVEDEVTSRAAGYGARRRLQPADGLFTDREIRHEVVELTSREGTNDVAAAKRRLALPFSDDEHVDVALATNMISVGLDITRLGLMTVLGQPKTSAEYIQATSRVGRETLKPSLVVVLLNIHKPRDRSHYERFEGYHASFYRSVEPTSVTPFSPRALDRALAGAFIALCRQGVPEMTPARGAEGIATQRSALDAFAQRFADRAASHDRDMDPKDAARLADNVRAWCRSLLDDWLNIADQYRQTNTRLRYQKYEGAEGKPLLHDFLDPEIGTLHESFRRFRANRSMRDVETSVDVQIENLNDWDDRPLQ